MCVDMNYMCKPEVHANDVQVCITCKFVNDMQAWNTCRFICK